ncbi:hypothetical protein SO694_00080170 [Aureococcus anophagefferens]|uniref:C2H2-type domain-containing protein n=2 Tax=Aureococcus anophagefferens TaxID=44056 RepID=A0ABR1G4U9_AURAN
MVTRWHESAQRPGFKFLVVQIVCNLTGGPQRYTGRPMDEAHKHLNISEAEWGVFMGLFNEVCGEFGLPAEDQDDLNALMISMEDECVVYPGERPRRDPGPWRPGGHAAYGLCGGVYPIALFADRLVDALLADARFKVATDAKRTPAALKYLLTEAVCKACGGPEVVTARGAPEAQLGVPKGAWRAVNLTARAAADHVENDGARRALLAAFDRGCRGAVVDESNGAGDFKGVAGRAATVKSKDDAAAGAMVSAEEFASSARAAGVVAPRARRPSPRAGPSTATRGRSTAAAAAFWISAPRGPHDGRVDVRTARSTRTRRSRGTSPCRAPGFKFLVTQLMGYLTGGPQRYTGRPMDVAHKHLHITPAEWARFAAVADDVMRAAGVQRARRARAPRHRRELRAPVHDGAGRGPGPSRARRGPTRRRSRRCGASTTLSSASARDEWDAFKGLACKAAAKVFPTHHHHALALRTLEKAKADLCVGLAVGETGDVGPASGHFDDGPAAVPPAPPAGAGGCPFGGRPPPAGRAPSPAAARAFREKQAAALVEFGQEIVDGFPDARADMACEALERAAEYLRALRPTCPPSLTDATATLCAHLLSTAADGTWRASAGARRLQGLALECNGAGDDGRRKVTCLCCYDDYRANEGLECDGGEKHFFCGDCLQGLKLAENLDDASFAGYVRAKENLAEAKAFADFNGCFALTCSRPGCGCGFCAYCLQDCGKDAHEHVRHCRKHGATGDFFGDFDAARATGRSALFRDFLRRLPKAWAARLVKDCARDLADLKLGGEADFANCHHGPAGRRPEDGRGQRALAERKEEARAPPPNARRQPEPAGRRRRGHQQQRNVAY